MQYRRKNVNLGGGGGGYLIIMFYPTDSSEIDQFEFDSKTRRAAERHTGCIKKRQALNIHECSLL